MTAREWKPDLAFISWRSQSGRSGGSAIALRCSRAYDESHWQTQTFGEIPDHKVTDIRPLVVIDPEDRKPAVDIAQAAASAAGVDPGVDISRVINAVQTALREFANPTPPRPEEPTGLGAVVEDAEGERWVRKGTTDHGEDWARQIGNAWTGGPWDRISAVRVLSEGVL